MKPSRLVEGFPAYYFEELEVGMSGEHGRLIVQPDVASFAELSGDYNPLHFSREYANTTVFGEPIVHGMLTASLISTAIACKMPGPGCIYVRQELRFKAPVKAGDYVTARATVEALDPEKKRATLRTTCMVGDTLVLDGTAVIQVPSRELLAAE